MKFKNNKNNILFIMSSILFISLILFVLYKIEDYRLYEKLGDSILLIVVYYLLLSIIAYMVIIKVYKVILKYFYKGNKKLEFTKDERRRYVYLTIGFTLIMRFIDDLLHFDNIEPVFLKLIVKSSFISICLLIGVNYVNKITEERDEDN
jgi:hypothetical protein